jgi:hypothetical protein
MNTPEIGDLYLYWMAKDCLFVVVSVADNEIKMKRVDNGRITTTTPYTFGNRFHPITCG